MSVSEYRRIPRGYLGLSHPVRRKIGGRQRLKRVTCYVETAQTRRRATEQQRKRPLGLRQAICSVLNGFLNWTVFKANNDKMRHRPKVRNKCCPLKPARVRGDRYCVSHASTTTPIVCVYIHPHSSFFGLLTYKHLKPFFFDSGWPLYSGPVETVTYLSLLVNVNKAFNQRNPPFLVTLIHSADLYLCIASTNKPSLSFFFLSLPPSLSVSSTCMTVRNSYNL